MLDELNRKILVVEDDPRSREILIEALETRGFQIDSAENAEQALSKIKFWNPHLVLTDHDMPDCSGLEMLKKLRSNQYYVTVIFVSGRTDSKVVSEALRSGADDFVRKPFRIEELLARIDVALRHNDAHRDLHEANQKLQAMVDQDYLTGLFNMRSTYEKIDYELSDRDQTGQQVAAIMLDMDHFKTVNDHNDHLFGSFVLKEMGHLIKTNIRDVDFAARYGGDEFLIVLVATNPKGVQKFCDRFRKTIEEFVFISGQDKMSLTISMGWAISELDKKETARDLVRKADHALYFAKNTGRNKVGSYSDVQKSKKEGAKKI